MRLYSRIHGGCVHVAVEPIPGVRVRVHRFLLGTDAPEVDHRDGDGLNNTRANLRPCTKRQNLGNAPRRKGGGFKGVYRSGDGWRAICAKAWVGHFRTEKAAAIAYDRAARARWGSFACVNFPEVGERSALTGEVRVA